MVITENHQTCIGVATRKINRSFSAGANNTATICKRKKNAKNMSSPKFKFGINCGQSLMDGATRATPWNRPCAPIHRLKLSQQMATTPRDRAAIIAPIVSKCLVVL